MSMTATQDKTVAVHASKSMKIKAQVTINIGLYMDIRPEIEIEVPNGLQGPELVQWLHSQYHGILTPDKLSKIDKIDHKKSKDVGLESAEHDTINF